MLSVLPQALRVLGNVPLFSCLSREQLTQVAVALQTQSYPMGSRIIEKGTPGNDFFIVKVSARCCVGSVSMRRSV